MNVLSVRFNDRVNLFGGDLQKHLVARPGLVLKHNVERDWVEVHLDGHKKIICVPMASVAELVLGHVEPAKPKPLPAAKAPSKKAPSKKGVSTKKHSGATLRKPSKAPKSS